MASRSEPGQVVLGVRPDSSAFGYAFVVVTGQRVRVPDAGVVRARRAYASGADPAASAVRAGRELAGLLRVVASRERVDCVVAPAFVVEPRMASARLVSEARAWGQVDVLAEALGARVVVVPPGDVQIGVDAAKREFGEEPWAAELGGGRLEGVSAAAWVALAAALSAVRTGRVALGGAA